VGAARADDALREAWRAVREALPAPDEAAAYVVEGVVRMDGKDAGPFRLAVSAAPNPLGAGPMVWRVETRLPFAREEAYWTRALVPLSGRVEDPGRGRRHVWRRGAEGVETSIFEGDDEVARRTVEEEGPAVLPWAGLLLLARTLPAARFEGEALRFRPEFEPMAAERPYEPISLAVRPDGRFDGRPALLLEAKEEDRTVVIAVEPEGRTLVGLRASAPGRPVLDLVVEAAAPGADPFEGPAGRPAVAALRAWYAFTTADRAVLDAVIHWPSVRASLGDQVPASVTPEAFREAMLARLLETIEDPRDGADARPVGLAALPDFRVEETGEGRAEVVLPPRLKGLRLRVGLVDGHWYLVELP
jgi:hypothetical protein